LLALIVYYQTLKESHMLKYTKVLFLATTLLCSTNLTYADNYDDWMDEIRTFLQAKDYAGAINSIEYSLRLLNQFSDRLDPEDKSKKLAPDDIRTLISHKKMALQSNIEQLMLKALNTKKLSESDKIIHIRALLDNAIEERTTTLNGIQDLQSSTQATQTPIPTSSASLAQGTPLQYPYEPKSNLKNITPIENSIMDWGLNDFKPNAAQFHKQHPKKGFDLYWEENKAYLTSTRHARTGEGKSATDERLVEHVRKYCGKWWTQWYGADSLVTKEDISFKAPRKTSGAPFTKEETQALNNKSDWNLKDLKPVAIQFRKQYPHKGFDLFWEENKAYLTSAYHTRTGEGKSASDERLVEHVRKAAANQWTRWYGIDSLTTKIEQ
jgi:hypothetical protein